MQDAVVVLTVDANGSGAARPELGEDSALRGDCEAGGGVVESGEGRRERGRRGGGLAEALDGQRALPGGRDHVREFLGGGVEESEAGQPGAREDDGVQVLGSAAQPGWDVAADVDDVEVRAGPQQLSGAAG